ncbi:hypothetical protein [Jiangella sp. DSM 45060]|uniref:hypothetical protein n=1 Tax=Jiangella sp. DSM 45060 TaxID=1798224 RepID=UPI000879A622|nr:hypothetical protein [Jiangella sp. DSM 45060]SDT70542.1 hypothetical protein SAMN04515669_6220 [Jiangella sp. DSM 45060]
MGVCNEVYKSDSALRRFLDERLPARHQVADEWSLVVGRSRRQPVRLGMCGDYAAIGTALEMRIGLDLASKPAYLPVLRSLTAERCEKLLRVAGFDRIAPEWQMPDMTEPTILSWTRVKHPTVVDDDQIEALLACYAAAADERIARVCRHESTEIQRRIAVRGLNGGGRQRHPDHDREVTRAMTPLWQAYLDVGRSSLSDLGELSLVQIELAAGYAVADLLIGTTLVEVKNYGDPAAEMRAVLDQVLTYALLNRWRPHLAIDTVAAYFGWHAVTVSVQLDDLLNVSSPGPTPGLHEISSDLRQAIANDLEDARYWHECDELSRRRV